LASAIALSLGGAATTGYADNFRPSSGGHGVFVMTNDADSNEVVVFERDSRGGLHQGHSYRTGGRGSGGTIDPLTSQGSLTLSADHHWLFAANAGSGTLSVFRVEGTKLFLTDEVSTEGSEPNAVAQRGDLVYVVNTAASSNVVGFRFNAGHLRRIDDSLRLLTGNNVGSASIAFSPDGRTLTVTERVGNSFDVFGIQADGRLSVLTNTPGAVPGTFAATFAPNGTLISSETGSGAPLSSTVTSYAVQPNRTLKAISTQQTNGNANCWNVVTPNGKFVYVSNSGSASIAGFAIQPGGVLAPLHLTDSNNPPGSANLDIAIGVDGLYLYTLNAATGTVGVFQIDEDKGTLKNLGVTGELPAGAGLNGIAAN
jgi:6-phosphogluconolactonase (cycloisomerase 2 family)